MECSHARKMKRITKHGLENEHSDIINNVKNA